MVDFSSMILPPHEPCLTDVSRAYLVRRLYRSFVVMRMMGGMRVLRLSLSLW